MNILWSVITFASVGIIYLYITFRLVKYRNIQADKEEKYKDILRD
jgi:hypothetical protein